MTTDRHVKQAGGPELSSRHGSSNIFLRPSSLFGVNPLLGAAVAVAGHHLNPDDGGGLAAEGAHLGAAVLAPNLVPLRQREELGGGDEAVARVRAELVRVLLVVLQVGWRWYA